MMIEDGEILGEIDEEKQSFMFRGLRNEEN